MEQKKALNLINLYNVKGNRHGYWEIYYDNGNLSSKGNYVDGNEHGYWEYYYSNGNLFSKGNYVDGKLHGYWESYWDNGNLGYKGFYDMGNKVDYNPDEPKVTELTLDEIIFPCILEVSQSKDFTESLSMMPNKKQVCICKLGDKYVCIESPEEQNDFILETINKGIQYEYGCGGGMMLIFWNYARKINNQK